MMEEIRMGVLLFHLKRRMVMFSLLLLLLCLLLPVKFWSLELWGKI
uniref:Uncharacterized protein n=1 Tax=Cucumis melo TaxID=3656 RepID=A0A9I9E344_CUCME